MTEKNLRMLLLVDIVGFLSLVSLSLVPKCFWALSPSALINKGISLYLHQIF